MSGYKKVIRCATCGDQKYAGYCCDSDMYDLSCDACGSKEFIYKVEENLIEQPTLRDQFAMAALTGILANPQCKPLGMDFNEQEIKRAAEKIADVMMERNQEVKKKKIRTPLPGYEMSIDECSHPKSSIVRNLMEDSVECMKCGAKGYDQARGLRQV